MKKLFFLLILAAGPAFAQTTTPAPTALETAMTYFPKQREIDVKRITFMAHLTTKEAAEYEKTVPTAIQNQCAPLIQKYKDMTKLITKDTVKQNVEMIRAKLLVDTPYWKQESEREVAPLELVKINATPAQRLKARNAYADRLLKQALSQANYGFVSSQMPQWLAQLEGAAKQQAE